MATEHQRAQLEKRLREYRKKYLTKKQNMDVNESATRIMVNYFLTEVLNYEELEDIKTEYAIRGEYADYVIQLKRKKHFVVEVKSIDLDLNERHLRQSISYAANEGIDWILLFNGRQIQLYRVIFAKPISTHQVFSLDLRDLSVLKNASEHLVNLMKASILKNDLEVYWKRFNALTPESLVKTIYTKDVINAVRLKVKKVSGINFDNQEVLDAIHELIVHECKAVRPKLLK
ncbi:type I restriction enzyme HsdR N-terminal domain-containing protein [Candidatus Saccharibacteria bacterium]|nr:MAG: type I restriction enzyme HsdR N-terminal domain-containing protein [Candidatus Saccharibacteria bacterium]